MSSTANWNDHIITEFRKNAGRVGGYFAGTKLLLLHVTGRRSGKTYIHPLAYSVDGDHLVVAASKGGADTNPEWFLNLEADPDVTVELGDRTVSARAVVPEGAERDRLWAAHVAAMPSFADYEKATDRVIPVVVLELASDRATA